MNHRLNYSPKFLSKLGWPVFWLGMLLMHVGGLVAAWSVVVGWEAGEWGTSLIRALFLSVSAVFFALKTINVKWLRLPSGRRTVIASAMVIGLLHFNVFERVAEVNLPSGAVPLGIVLFAGTLLESERLRRALSRFPRAAGAFPRMPNHPLPFLCGLTGPAWERVFKPHLMRIVANSVPLRAPPC